MHLIHNSTGNKQRTIESTKTNEISSRSHAVLQINVEQKAKSHQKLISEVLQGRLCFIDLAGSERAANFANTGQRMVESSWINKSLLALGNCIDQLNIKHRKGDRPMHIPYRNSKLTRLLKESLSGNCRTVMIANISTNEIAFEDT